jgi:hypothetical protein
VASVAVSMLCTMSGWCTISGDFEASVPIKLLHARKPPASAGEGSGDAKPRKTKPTQRAHTAPDRIATTSQNGVSARGEFSRTAAFAIVGSVSRD